MDMHTREESVQGSKLLCQVEQLNFSYGKNRIIRDLSLNLYEGKRYLLVGANGCGKSTLIGILAGVLQKTDGRIRLPDGDCGEGMKDADVRMLGAFTGYVPQGSALIPELTVYDNLLLWYGTKEALQSQMKEGYIKKLHLEELLPLKVSKLSGGMNRRASIACAMAGKPRLLLMDEPGASLDLECRLSLSECLELYCQSGGCVFFSSHDQADLEEADHIYAMRGGALTEIDGRLKGKELWNAITGRP